MNLSRLILSGIVCIQIVVIYKFLDVELKIDKVQVFANNNEQEFLTNFTTKNYQDAELVSKFQANKWSVNLEQGEHEYINPVVYFSKDLSMSVTADRGTSPYSKGHKLEILYLYGNVEANNIEKLSKLTADTAVYNRQKQTINGSGNIKLTTPDGILTGKEFIYNINRNEIEITGEPKYESLSKHL